MRNIPSYTMSSRTDSKHKVLISKQHKVEQVGRDSPGVGTYDYDYETLSKTVLSKGEGGHDYSFGFGTRFFDFRQQATLKSTLYSNQ